MYVTLMMGVYSYQNHITGMFVSCGMVSICLYIMLYCVINWCFPGERQLLTYDDTKMKFVVTDDVDSGMLKNHMLLCFKFI